MTEREFQSVQHQKRERRTGRAWSVFQASDTRTRQSYANITICCYIYYR